MGFNDFLWSVFQGYKVARDDNLDKRYRELNWTMDCWVGEATTALYDVKELNELVGAAKTKEHYNAILDHLYRHDATRVDVYKDIENKIIDRMW